MALSFPKCPSSSHFAHLPPSSHQPRNRPFLASPLSKPLNTKWVASQSRRNRQQAIVCCGEAASTVAKTTAKDISTKQVENGTLPSISKEEFGDVVSFGNSEDKSTVSITVVGASGDLAKKKIFPALFALYYEDCLPKHFTIFGYARSKMTDGELRNMVSKTLTCRIDKRENCSDKMDQFLKRCFYHSGQYDSEESFAELDKKLKEQEVMECVQDSKPLPS